MSGTYSTFSESQIDLQQKLFMLEKDSREKKFEITDMADYLPVGLLINHRCGMNLYMNKTSCEVLRYARDEIMELGEEYSKTIVFDKDEYERVNVMHEEFFERNDKTEIYSNFQKLRPKGEEDYQWMYVTSKIYRWDDNGLPVERLLISMPVSLMGDVSDKVNKVLDENIYLKKNFHKFSVLTKREKEILKNIALGKSSTLIADELFISKFTVDQHRKNIKSKLALKSIADMVKFAETFDLI